MAYILAPSILAADFTRLGEEMKATEENGAEYLHFDVMDACLCQVFRLECLFLHPYREQQGSLWTCT